jgi:hypothetical protein
MIPFGELIEVSASAPGLVTLGLSACATLSTIFGGLVAVHSRKRTHLLLGTGAGMLLGATFFDLLPESVDVGRSQGWDVRVIFLILVAGFLGFYVAERTLILHSCVEGDCSKKLIVTSAGWAPWASSRTALSMAPPSAPRRS